MKKPFVTKEQIEEIVKTYPTPFHIYDEKGIRENVKALKEAFSWNKGYKEFFAVKATPNPCLIQILREYGCGCDCSSLTELMLSGAMGAGKGDIMFSSNDTPAHEFAYAAKLGAIINLDDITHIDFLERTIGYIPKTISCRFNPGGYFSVANSIMDNPGDAKYGFTTEQMFEGFRILKSKGAENFGIHAFLASNTVSNEYYPELARQLFELAVKLKAETGANITFINLSGGIGIPYKPDDTPNDIRIIGEGVRREYEKILVPAGMGNVAIYTELGRFMMGPYGHLITRVIHEKHTHKEYVGVDACAVNLMRPAMYGAYHHITVLGKENEPCCCKYDVTGSLCENNDKFAIDRMLPRVEIGDYLAIHDTGAHGFAMGYNYNGKLRSAELLLREDGSVQLIRRAETPRDYFATFDCLDIYDKLDFESYKMFTGEPLWKLELQDTEWPFTSTDQDREIARAIVVDGQGSYYFVRAVRDDDFGKATLIETAGGGVEEGEELPDAVRRELKEELGADVEILGQIGVVSDYYNLIHRHNINHYYLCRISSLGEKHLTSQETDSYHLTTLKMSYEEAVGEYEKRAETKLGKLIAARELPVLRRAKEMLDKNCRSEGTYDR